MITKERRIEMPRWDDFHVHLRIDQLLVEVLQFTARYCSRAIAMPNLRPRAVLNAQDVIWYRDEIRRVRDSMPIQYPFEPLMTIEIRDNTTPDMIRKAKKAGAVAGKV
jgi:dihydroorotase